jgi:putative CocE/NonD family hydrolase
MGLGVLFRRHRGDHPSLAQALVAWASELDALGTSGYASLPLGVFAPLRRQSVAPAFFDTIGSPMDRTQELIIATSIFDQWDQARVPSFNIGGWYDIFLADTIASFNAMQVRGIPSRLLIGPWTHLSQGGATGGRNFGFGAGSALIDLQIDLNSMQLRWFDHWLKGVDTGMMNEPPIRLFVMGANIWRDEQEWPLARAVNTPWYLREGGALSPEEPTVEAPDRYDYDPANPVPTLGGATLMAPEYRAGPYDQRPIESRPDILVYRSAPLQRDTEVTGPITVHLWARSSAPDTDFVARLVDIAPDGTSYNLTDGIVRARYRNFCRGEPPSLIEPGQLYEYIIDLWATSNVFKAGHRMGLHITSSSFPRWDRNPNTGHPFGVDAELQVAHQENQHDREHPSRVILPTIGPV